MDLLRSLGDYDRRRAAKPPLAVGLHASLATG